MYQQIEEKGKLWGVVLYFVAWAFFTFICILVYNAGCLAAPIFGWEGDAKIFGVVTLVASVWLYISFDQYEKLKRLNEKIDALEHSLQDHDVWHNQQ